MRQAHHRASAAALCAAVVLAACDPFDADRPFSERELAADPAHAVRPPDAFELFHVGADNRETIDGPAYAFDGFVMATQLSEGELFAFYDQQLRAMGWLHDDHVFVRSDETAARGWCKPKVTFAVGIFKPGDARRFLGAGQSFVTVFDAALQVRTRELPCPYFRPTQSP